jgi:carbonic anhydrase/acetyltransferase-like protein (isoleucine patch superfamily)
MIRSYKGIRPRLGQRVFVDEGASVIGDVEIGDDSSVWMGSIVRGDVNVIRIGARTNIQDLTVIHVQTGSYATLIADDVTVGHSVVLHGCRIEEGALIGIGARVLNGAVVGAGSIVAAGALVPEGMAVPPRSLVMGLPARVVRTLSDAEVTELRSMAARYVALKDDYLAEAQVS